MACLHRARGSVLWKFNVKTDLRTVCLGQRCSLASICPGFIGSLAKYSIDLQGFSFFSMLRCIFDSNVKHYVFTRFSSVFPQSMYIYCTELSYNVCSRMPVVFVFLLF